MHQRPNDNESVPWELCPTLSQKLFDYLTVALSSPLQLDGPQTARTKTSRKNKERRLEVAAQIPWQA